MPPNPSYLKAHAGLKPLSKSQEHVSLCPLEGTAPLLIAEPGAGHVAFFYSMSTESNNSILFLVIKSVVSPKVTRKKVK